MTTPKPFHNTFYTIFATRSIEFAPGVNYSAKILLTEYCKRRFITRRVVEKLINRKWVTVTKVRGRIYVEEICTDKIDEYLDVRCD